MKKSIDVPNFPKLLPDSKCVICCKTLDDVGGKRIIAQQFRGIIISKEYRGGGNPDYPYKSFNIPHSRHYLVVWGEVSLWNDSAIKMALSAIQSSKQPWLCQVCASRTCSICGSPINYPMASDILYDNGCSSHCAIFPFNPGCMNQKCNNYKEWGE